MKKTLNINLGGMIFHIDEDAFNKLEAYLGALRQQFIQTNGGSEILNDVETRMAELFRERTSESKQVINIQDVDEVIAIMGRPEDYLDEEMASNTSYSYEESYSSNGKKIHRDVDNRIVGGVASGLAAYFNMDALWIRILFLASFFAGFGFLLYLILWAIIPAARTTTEKLQMRGKPVTLSNIENFVKEEGAAMGAKMSELGGKARNVGRSGQSLLAQLFSGIFEIIRLILKFIFKAIGFIFLGIGLVIIAILAISLFIGVEINDYHYNISELSNIVQLLAIDSSSYNSMMIGASLLLLGPLLLLVYYGLRIVFGIEPLNSGVRRGLALTSLAGVILLVISGIKVAHEFEDHATQSQEFNLESKNGMIYMEVNKDSLYDQMSGYRNSDHWLIYNAKSYFSDIEFDIQRSNSANSYLVKKVNARGSSRDEARLNARSPEHFLKIDSGLVVSGIYYTIPEGKLYRAQKIRLVLYLAKGDTVFLGPGMESIIDDIANVQNYWDPDMVGHYWTMTDHGLLCTDCPEKERIEERWENEEEEDVFKDYDSDSKVRIEDDLIRIEEVEVWYEEVKPIRVGLLNEPLFMEQYI